MFGVPPNTLPMVMYMYTYRYFATGYYCIRTCHSKQFSVGLMVLSDGLVYFLKMEKIFCLIHQNYLVALTLAHFHHRIQEKHHSVTREPATSLLPRRRCHLCWQFGRALHSTPRAETTPRHGTGRIERCFNTTQWTKFTQRRFRCSLKVEVCMVW